MITWARNGGSCMGVDGPRQEGEGINSMDGATRQCRGGLRVIGGSPAVPTQSDSPARQPPWITDDRRYWGRVLGSF